VEAEMLRIKANTLLLLFVLSAASPALAESDSAFLDRARNEWASREADVSAFVMRWTENHTVFKGMDGRDRNGGPLPSKDSTFEISYEFKCDGRRVAFSRRGVQFDMSTLQHAEKSFVSTFDGGQRRQLFVDPWSGTHPGGFLRHGNTYAAVGNLRDLAPVLILRPLAAELGGPALDKFRDTGQRRTHAGLSCRLFEAATSEGITDTYSIEDGGLFRIVRVFREYSDKTTEELAIAYGEEEKSYLCAGWTFSCRGRTGKLTQVDAVIRPEMTVNMTIPGDEFVFAFPPGAVVTDELSNQISVVRNDGSFREVTQGELAAGIDFDTLMATPPLPEALSEAAARSRERYGWLIAAGIAVAATALLVKRRRSGS
jgi:hypothetical protein